MTRAEIEQHVGKQVELSYTLLKNVPGIVIEDGIERKITVKREIPNIRVGVIIALTIRKAIFIMDDDNDDFEISVPFENITKIRKIKEYEAI